MAPLDSDNAPVAAQLTPAQQVLSDLWEEHMKAEFVTRSADDAVADMVEDAHVTHVPVMTGGVGREQVREFYGTSFIPQMPPDLQINPISRTIGTERVVDEMVLTATHSVHMDWLLPGLPPTGKRMEIALVAIIGFRDGKLASEHIYWDQASVLVQLGLLDPQALPVAGAESARKVLDPTLPANTLIERAERRRP
jgi:carboxymethylenebutenolidase